VIPPIKDIIKDNFVTFVRYRQGYFYYKIWVKRPLDSPESTQPLLRAYSFPVPLSDIGDATLEEHDKAIIFMRYIRKAIEDKTFIPFL
jgi:hypothetical protein